MCEEHLKGIIMSMGINNVSFYGKFAEQKAAKFIDSASKQAENAIKRQRPLIEQQETYMREAVTSPKMKKFMEKLKSLEAKDQYVGIELRPEEISMEHIDYPGNYPRKIIKNPK